jgi:hypothetical protein
MTVLRIDAVGFCAHYSDVGDWAFDYALALARRWSVPLKVFHFLSDPYDPTDDAAARLSATERAELALKLERDLRMYYDERAGNYLDVGFRLCEDPEWTELHRCLLIREFQVLVLGYVTPEATFSGRPIMDFATSFVSPVVLVGPYHRKQLRFNSQAALISDKLDVGRELDSPIAQLSNTIG